MIGTNVTTKINAMIEKLLSYQFAYADPVISDVANPTNPIVVVAPAEGDSNLRVYAYGGQIGSISTKDGSCKLATDYDHPKPAEKKKILLALQEIYGDKEQVHYPLFDYGKYLIDGYVNGHQHKFMADARLKEKYLPADAQDHIWGLYDVFDELVKEYCGREEELLVDSRYLDLIVYATYTRFLHRKKDCKEPLSGSERSRQSLIAKHNMQTAKLSNGDLLVIDIECDIPLNNNPALPKITHLSKKGQQVEHANAKIDFVVFDGASFGLVEFKYLGESMEANSDNSLKNHFIDFRRILVEDEQNLTSVREKLKSRLKCVVSDYPLVADAAWKSAYESLEDDFDIWCGFYFVGDEADPRNHREKKDIKRQIVNQIKPFFTPKAKNPVVRFGYEEIMSSEVRLDQLITKVWAKDI